MNLHCFIQFTYCFNLIIRFLEILIFTINIILFIQKNVEKNKGDKDDAPLIKLDNKEN